MKYTVESSRIMHEIGHFIFFTLYLSSKSNLEKSTFCYNVKKISIVPDKKDNSFGRVMFNLRTLRRSKIGCYFTLLSGVLCDLLLVDHSIEKKFDKVKDIRRNLIDVYSNLGGGSDLLRLIKDFVKSSTFDKVAVYIYELRKQIYKLWDQEVIRSITRKLYRKLQKDKEIHSEGCYKIIEPYIPELKKLGKQVYGPKTKLSVYAKIILF
jgi:hypothetical protein